jgi:uncharacterized protein (TIGR02996 family)
MSGATYPDAFLQAIIEAPDDDTPRLAYADWLDENGDPEQAEFIRGQLELATLPAGDPRRAALEGRAGEARWLGPLPVKAFIPAFHRGLVEEVAFYGPREFFACADELFRRLPVRHLTIHASQGDSLDAEGVRALAALPQLAHLHALLLWDQDFGDEGASILAACPSLANLRTLSLPGCEIGPFGAAALAASPYLANLLELDLYGNTIGVAGGRTLLDSTHLSRLKVLDIGENYYGSEEGEDELLEEMEEHFGDGLRFGESLR